MNTKTSALNKMREGAAAMQRGQTAEAEVMLQDSLNEFQAIGDPVFTGEVCMLLGELNLAANRPTTAFAFFEKAGEQAAGMLQLATDRLGNSLHARAVLYMQSGKLVEAFLLLMHASHTFEGTASTKAAHVQVALQQLRAQIGPVHLPAIENYWNGYQQALDQGRRGGQRSLMLQLTN